MQASAVHAPALGRRPLSVPLLRLRSDEQLVALFRSGSEDAFAAIHDRYRLRLFAYVRQMLAKASRADAEDVLQDVFVRAYGALRADRRDVHLRAWLYRVAHNRCIDHLRRPAPPPDEVFEMSRAPLQDPIEAAQRRDDLKRLVADVGRLPDQQRSALLMREIDGLAYADIADALDVTVPAVKSLLVRARVGLTEAAEARDTDCAVIHADLTDAYDRGVKASARARRHMRECPGCREYRAALKGMRRSFAALSPAGALGPLALAAKALGLGGAGGGAAAGGSAAIGGGAGLAGSGVAAATACKVAAVVCTAVVATGGAVEVKHLAAAPLPAGPARHAGHGVARRATAPRAVTAPAVVAAPVSARTIRHRTDSVAAPATTSATPRDHATVAHHAHGQAPYADVPDAGTPAGDGAVPPVTGGSRAPGDAAAPPAASGTDSPPSADAVTGTAAPTGAGAPTSPGSGGAAPGAATGAAPGTAPAASPPAPPPAPAPSADATAATPPASTGPPPEH